MGYASDLGTSHVHDLCPETGYPRDRWGRLLSPLSLHDGTPVFNWRKPGTELYNLTSPYGHLHFAHGTGDDFVCWDYAVIQAVTGEYIILDATVNSETGGFIDGMGYLILPVRSSEERREAVWAAEGMVGGAIEWTCCNEVRATIRGWNQRPEYFRNCVARALFPWKFKKQWTERMMRMNTKLIQRAIKEILDG